MKRRLVVTLLLMALLPMAALGWFGMRLAVAEGRAAAQQQRTLAELRLRDVSATVQAVVVARERQLRDLLANLPFDAPAAADLGGSEPTLSQVILIGEDGSWVYPDEETSAPGFWRRAAALRDDRVVFASSDESGLSSGWHTWFWNSGIHFIFFDRAPDGRVKAAELNRARLLADVIAALPAQGQTTLRGRMQLIDARGETLHQWGDLTADPPAAPFVEMSLSRPLESWRLAYDLPAAALPGGVKLSWLLNLFLVLCLMSAVFMALAVYAWRETRREFREAAQRVSFVNRVSHELKTPLTNVRMYAEMLGDELQACEPPHESRHLRVIISEAQRLTRMINNVLSFARHQQKKLTVKVRPAVIDEIVTRVLEHFGPSLSEAEISVKVAAAAPRAVAIDADAVEQILGNLLSNVEKYAAAGNVEITTAQSATATTITVADTGPGVPRRERRKIFRPFHRVSNRLTDGVSGAGIGLAIARDLARLMDGDLVLVETPQGATFRLELPAPKGGPEE